MWNMAGTLGELQKNTRDINSTRIQLHWKSTCIYTPAEYVYSASYVTLDMKHGVIVACHQQLVMVISCYAKLVE